MNLPESHEQFTDKYFLRTRQILEAEGINPFVRAQVFIRKGPGKVHGIDEAVAIIDTYSDLIKNGGRVFALEEGADYGPKETLIVIEGHIQDIVELETMYLGVLSAETTKANDGTRIDLDSITKNMEAAVAAAEGRPVSYFGARHWRYDMDAAIAKATFDGGATSCSTDIGAAMIDQVGMGTIPHALENIFASIAGYDRAVVEATLAFDRHMDESIPRIALIDYANKEIDDAIATADELEGRLYAVRVDTCGENIAQGALATSYHPDDQFWSGSGVTISGVYALRQALDKAGHEDVKIILTSGFGNVEKVEAFVRAEKELGVKLFDSLGVGGVYKARFATMDIVAVDDGKGYLAPMAKVGRTYSPNPRLKLVLGGGQE